MSLTNLLLISFFFFLITISSPFFFFFFFNDTATTEIYTLSLHDALPISYTDLPDGLLFPGFYYFNVRYLSGYTYKGRLIGHRIGRQGHGVQAWTTYWFSPQNTLQLGWRHGKVSGDFIPGGGTVNDISLHASFRIRPQMNLSTFLQYERWAFPVLSPGARSNLTSSLQLTFHPRLWNKQVDHD